MFSKIRVEEAVGKRLAHDLTQIIPGKFKGAAFRRGHIVKKEDLPRLLDMGKKQVFVLDLSPGELHEDEAAKRMAWVIAGKGIGRRGPREGKIDFLSKKFGLLKMNIPALERINSLGALILSTRHNFSTVRPDEVVAGTRAIPLTIRESKVRKVEEICRRSGPVLEILPFKRKKVGVVVTGGEIFEGRIKDTSADIVRKKTEEFGSRVARVAVTPDDPEWIGREIKKMKREGCEVIVTTGGLSVDPDDVTLEGILRSGAKVVFYGTPVLPGSMTAYARLGNAAILGGPACVVHDPVTALDLFLPRILADAPISAKDAVRLGHGGLCLRCPECRFPICPFGRS
ncbi:MAG: molybdopterin-binding protein [Deltaproteobacteria bacterium]|nr:molybdopterin-binding protein [Deltaproteobacteria bacterium]